MIQKMESGELCVWAVGQRIMMITNNYQINIMNGDEGTIVDVNDNGVVCKFKDEIEHTFKFGNTKKGNFSKVGDAVTEELLFEELTTESITKSFAITIHKAQGSEQNYVIIYIPLKFGSKGFTVSKFLNINLLYTAITRTKKCVWIIGSQVAIQQSTCQRQSQRCDNLSMRLKLTEDKEKESAINKINEEQLQKFKDAMGVKKLDEEDDYDPFAEPDTDGGCFLSTEYF
jgi:exodeoxyribonuclease V alpha subunit